MKKRETFCSIFHPDFNINLKNASDEPNCSVLNKEKPKRVTGASLEFGQDINRSSKLLGCRSTEIPSEDDVNHLYKASQSFPLFNKSSCKESLKNFSETNFGSHSLVSSFSEIRAKIEEISDHCVEEFLKEKKRFSEIYKYYAKNYPDLFEKRLKNLHLQNKEFGKFISFKKTHFMINNTESNSSYSASIIKTFYREASIFLCYFPAYALRETVLKEIETNQVTIISANSSYHFNIALPLILSNEYDSHNIISCEENKTLRTYLRAKINSVFSSEHLTLSNLELMVGEELLNGFSSIHSSQTNSLIIYNVPLKRSLMTDINLANLRDLLVLKRNLKLVLLVSPYNDIAKFQLYFSANVKISVLYFPSLCFPVKTIWKEALTSPDDDFHEDLTNTVFAIHVLCEPGDIIVFLPSAKDIESVSEELDVKIQYHQYNEIKVFCAGDKYNISEDSSIERRVFLFTSGCEDVIVPTSRYVIDCGVHEEYFFDSELDNNILIPTYISRARAQIRKQLAGAFNIGTCFRLYNKSNFLQNMHPKEYSEFFCHNPVHSMIKVFEHRHYSGEVIEFVESLPGDVQKSTLDILKSFGAFDVNSCITPLWKQIVNLPLPVKHSQLLLLGIRWGYAYEAVVLVAFFSIKKRLFVESQNEVQQKLIDVAKLDFNQHDSDTLTYLSLFKMWKENGFKKVWCQNHCVNFDVLKSIRYKINELCHLIQEKLGEEIRQEFSEDKDPNDLVQMLFECFRNNLCSYTGHPKTGYRILASKQFAFVHPSSFLYLKDYPSFIIYEDLVLDHVINLTCIPPDTVMEYLQNGILKFDSEEIFEDRLVQRVIDSVGEKVIKQVFLANNATKTMEIENDIKEETGAKLIVLEPILEKGCVNVYAFPDDIENCITSLNNILKHSIQTMLKEEEVKIIHFNKGQNSIQLETKWTKGAETVLCETLNYFPITKAAASSEAVISSECMPTSINYLIKLVWPRRFCTGEGYLNVMNANDFRQARKLALRSFNVLGNDVFVELSEKKAYQLRLSGIVPEVTQEDLIQTFSNYLSCKFEIELCYLPPFLTSAKEVLDMKKQIEENCRDNTNIRNFDVQISEPKPSSKFMNAYVHVFETRCLDREAHNLSRTKVNDMKLSCTVLYCSDLKCSVSVYRALYYRIKSDLENFNHEYIRNLEKEFSFNIQFNKDDSVSFKFSANDIEIVKSLQMKMNDLLHGVVLDKNNVKNIQRLFCHGGLVHLKSLESSTNVLIVQNFENKTIRLYGEEENCNFVREDISYFLDEAEEATEEIILSSRTILKALITQYGVNLEKFIELNGLRSAALDIKKSVLILYGRRENIEKATECVKDLSDSASDVCCSLPSGEICPVCASTAENLTIRLEHCGHVYCFECVQMLIQQANFPLQCCAEDCSKDLVLEDIKYVLNHDPQKIDELAEKSLKAYLEKNRDRIFYCPAPDCSMFVYKKELNTDKWSCPLCKNSICTKCRVVYHEGYSCDMYQGSRNDPDYSFKVWQSSKSKDCKICPDCSSAIEKRDGCNHMTCSVCQCHFCWLCLKKYRTGGEVYRHIEIEHRGQLFLP